MKSQQPSSLKFKSGLMSLKLTSLTQFFRSLKTKNTSVEVLEVKKGSGTKRSPEGDLPLPPSKRGKSQQSTPALVGVSYDPTNNFESDFSDSSSNDSHSDSNEMKASTFDESTNLGLKVNEDLATRVNDSFTKKPMQDKMKAIVEKYKTLENCDMLCAPRVNEPLRSDLEKLTKSHDLGLQDVQKCMSLIDAIQMTKESRKNKSPIDAKL